MKAMAYIVYIALKSTCMLLLITADNTQTKIWQNYIFLLAKARDT
jgi:hypothetical protein